jgi:hypothetical protein
MNQHYFAVPFAVEGDLQAIPNATDPNGYVSYNQGFTYDYQRDLQTDNLAKQIQRVTINQAYNDITTALQNIQQYGTSEFIYSADNQGTAFAYDIYALCRYSVSGTSPFGLFLSTVSANTSQPGTAGSWVNVGKALANSGAIQPIIALNNVGLPAVSTSYPCVITFTPSCEGFVDVSAYSAIGNGLTPVEGFYTNLTITGSGVSNAQGTGETADPQNVAVMAFGSAKVAAGSLVTVTATVTTLATSCGPFQTNLKVAFIPAGGNAT